MTNDDMARFALPTQLFFLFQRFGWLGGGPTEAEKA